MSSRQKRDEVREKNVEINRVFSRDEVHYKCPSCFPLLLSALQRLIPVDLTESSLYLTDIYFLGKLAILSFPFPSCSASSIHDLTKISPFFGVLGK